MASPPSVNDLNGATVLVLGLGESGLAMARWCARAGAKVRVWDSRESPTNATVLADHVPDATWFRGPLGDEAFAGVLRVLKSPGLAPSDARIAAPLARARAGGIAVQGELDLFAEALARLRAERGYAPKVLAVTGTNGKTTTTAMAAQLVARAGRRVAVAGNIGPTMLQTLADALDREPWADVPSADLAAAGGGDAASARIEAAAALIPSPDEALVLPPSAAELAALLPTRDARHPDDFSDGGPADDDLCADEPSADDLADLRALDGAASNDDEAPAVGADAVAPTVLRADDEPLVVESLLPAPPPAAPVFEHLPEVWVLELSSFQLDGVDAFEPSAATVLNLTEDHLDWHGTMADYTEAKRRVFGRRAVMVVNRDDPRVAALVPEPQVLQKAARGRKAVVATRDVVRFGLDAPRRPGDFGLVEENGMAWLVRARELDDTLKRGRGRGAAVDTEELQLQRLMPADALRVRGRHNAANALAALALASAIGCPLAPMLHALRDYAGEPHRVQYVATAGGVDAYDDSKGTNVGATVAALTGLGADRAPAKLAVILGGDGKGQDFAPLAAPVARHARAVALIGRDADRIAAALAGVDVPLARHDSLPAATRWCFARAHAGDAVLLSPACASLDMFRNYGHRADVFVAEVQALVAEEGGVAA